MADQDPGALLDVLEEARALGLLGPGPVARQLEHAVALGRSIGDFTGRMLDLGSGGVEQNLLFGVDYRDYDGFSEFGFGFGTAPTIDLFEPVYNTAPIADVPLFTSIDEKREQIGAYFQDQVKFGSLIVTLNARNDWVERNPAVGTSQDDEEFTYRVGATYLFDNGFAPYVQTSTSFQPTSGATFAVMRAAPPSTAAYCCSGAGCVASNATALPRSIAEPPPRATTPSQSPSRNTSVAASTASSVGFGGVSS